MCQNKTVTCRAKNSSVLWSMKMPDQIYVSGSDTGATAALNCSMLWSRTVTLMSSRRSYRALVFTIVALCYSILFYSPRRTLSVAADCRQKRCPDSFWASRENSWTYCQQSFDKTTAGSAQAVMWMETHDALTVQLNVQQRSWCWVKYEHVKMRQSCSVCQRKKE